MTGSIHRWRRTSSEVQNVGQTSILIPPLHWLGLSFTTMSNMSFWNRSVTMDPQSNCSRADVWERCTNIKLLVLHHFTILPFLPLQPEKQSSDSQQKRKPSSSLNTPSSPTRRRTSPSSTPRRRSSSNRNRRTNSITRRRIRSSRRSRTILHQNVVRSNRSRKSVLPRKIAEIKTNTVIGQVSQGRWESWGLSVKEIDVAMSVITYWGWGLAIFDAICGVGGCEG